MDVVHVRGLGLADATDTAILARAAQDGRIVVSRDSDFSGLLAQDGLPRPSFVHLRLPGVHGVDQLCQILLRALEEVSEELERGAVVTVRHDRIRVRSLPISLPTT